jgi:hypothetical protein
MSVAAKAEIGVVIATRDRRPTLLRSLAALQALRGLPWALARRRLREKSGRAVSE